MKYKITPERALKLIESILAPFDIRNRIDDSWEGKWWKLTNDSPQRLIIVWDKDGETVFTFDRAYDELTISTKHLNKIISYIPLDQKLLEVLLIALFGNLLDKKFHVERLDKSDLRRHDKEDLEDYTISD
jgi:hypothetical protein